MCCSRVVCVLGDFGFVVVVFVEVDWVEGNAHDHTHDHVYIYIYIYGTPHGSTFLRNALVCAACSAFWGL